MKQRKGLGRGLDALMGDDGGNAAAGIGGGDNALRELPLSQLRPGKGQPRKRFDEGELRALADSIRAHGFLQPIVARPMPDGVWEIIAGERRWRAAKLAGRATAPVVEKRADGQQAATLALVENLQRADLNPMEQSRGLAQLIADGGLTHAQAAVAVGMSRAAVSNLLRLSELSAAAAELAESGKLPMAHARALLSLPVEEQGKAANIIVSNGMSAREAEEYVRRMHNKNAGGDNNTAGGKDKKSADTKDADTAIIEKELSASLSAQVRISHHPSGKGTLTIYYGTLTTLQSAITRLRKKPRETTPPQ